eukprot:3418979-Heterocapsa_arctica.AAC.1
MSPLHLLVLIIDVQGLARGTSSPSPTRPASRRRNADELLNVVLHCRAPRRAIILRSLCTAYWLMILNRLRIWDNMSSLSM